MYTCYDKLIVKFKKCSCCDKLIVKLKKCVLVMINTYC